MKKIILGLFALSTGAAFAQKAPVKKTTSASKSVSSKSAAMSGNDSLAYAMGMAAATYYKQQGFPMSDGSWVKKAFEDVMTGKTTLLTVDQANMTLQQKLQVFRQARIQKNKEAGKQFLAQNKQRPGVVELPSGLQYEIITAGTGKKPTDTSTVKAHYVLTLIDGTKIESSRESGNPIEISLNHVIKGWTEALQMMPVGSKWKLYIPSDLAYGDRDGEGPIQGGSTLVFEVELLDIVK